MTTREPVSPRGSPDVAAVLTWFLPGAGHLYLGRPVFALIAFAIVQGVYFLGIRLSEGRLFEYLEPELQGLLAGILAPEAGNLGALVWQMRSHGFGSGIPQPWPEHMHLGTWLTAASGMLNACLMVRAHLDARFGERRLPALASPDVQILAAWLVPGLGHLLQGRRLRALAVFVMLVGLFALGTFLAAGSNLDRERHFYYWAGQFLIGSPAMLLEAVRGYPLVRSDIAYVDAGLVMVCVAGLLNVLAFLDVYAHAESRVRTAIGGRSDDRNVPRVRGDAGEAA